MIPYLIAEIGINHNGELRIAKQLIDAAADAGFDAVKFQKRTIDKVYTAEFLDSPRESPWGTTQRAQKEGLEFDAEAFAEIDRYCKARGIAWSASAWDEEAQAFLQRFDLPFNKVASPMLGHLPLLRMIAAERRRTFVSTGMATLEEIDLAVEVFRQAGCPFELMHCNSSYPMADDDANLLCIPMLRERYGCEVGYSGHESSLVKVCAAAVALGASSIERHITLDRAMYGSDQAASVEVAALRGFAQAMRAVRTALGDGRKAVRPEEQAARDKLRVSVPDQPALDPAQIRAELAELQAQPGQPLVHALIPARGGSKGVPGKNLRPAGGFPLLAYSILAARQAHGVHRTVVSTDTAQIADAARRFGADVPFLRPAEFARDDAPDMAYVGHYLDWLRSQGESLPDWLVILRPTTPLRDPARIDDAIAAFAARPDASSLRSVHALAEPPQKQLGIDNGWLVGLFPQDPRPEYYNLPRQAFAPCYQPNGYVDVVRVDLIAGTGQLYGSKAMAYQTDPVIEIDHPEDMAYLEYWIDRHGDPLLAALRRQFATAEDSQAKATG